MPRAEPPASRFAAISVQRAGYSPGMLLTAPGALLVAHVFPTGGTLKTKEILCGDNCVASCQRSFVRAAAGD